MLEVEQKKQESEKQKKKAEKEKQRRMSFASYVNLLTKAKDGSEKIEESSERKETAKEITESLSQSNYFKERKNSWDYNSGCESPARFINGVEYKTMSMKKLLEEENQRIRLMEEEEEMEAQVYGQMSPGIGNYNSNNNSESWSPQKIRLADKYFKKFKNYGKMKKSNSPKWVCARFLPGPTV